MELMVAAGWDEFKKAQQMSRSWHMGVYSKVSTMTGKTRAIGCLTLTVQARNLAGAQESSSELAPQRN